ncbi:MULTISPECIES: hypothetical protein [Actinosynnema]|uniref:hypothetical protein n=1 Tax=Actinosynnema TaxID=40566 RepID=UPI0020A52271|nr:hypothetical protein [Actinosynnema pretiosum]MCP2098654.1 Tissue inhibitor of metalloproteinase [Actinosynnema pretiosum]
MIRTFALALVSAFGLSLVATGTASACSCFPGTIGEHFDRADEVFVGTVVRAGRDFGDSDDPYDDRSVYRVKVSVPLKGDVGAWVNVVTATDSAQCGLWLQVGKRYLVFGAEGERANEVEANLCGGTQPV